jgi:hypothetical protein
VQQRHLLVLGVLVAAVGFLLLPAAGSAGGKPSIAFAPGSHDFGTIDKNTTASQTFVLKNTGGSATGALMISLPGSAFSKTADTCSATSLGPKKQCSVTVQYAPTTDGSNDTGTLTAQSKKPAAVATASLTGKSTAAPPTNLVPNPGFEDNCSGVPCHWLGNTATLAFDQGQFHSGLASLGVSPTGPTGGGALSDCFPISPSTAYSIDAWYLTSSSEIASIGVRLIDYPNTSCAGFPADTIIHEDNPPTLNAWTRLTGPATTGATAHSAYLFLIAECNTCSSSTVNFDDVGVTPSP